MSTDQLVLFTIILPLLGALGVALTGHRPNLREGVTITTALLTFVAVFQLYPEVAGGARPGMVLAEPLPGLTIALEVEPLGMVFGLLASFLWIVTSVYAIGYMRGHHEENQTRFFLFFAISIASAIGVAFAANMFTLFLFYEILTLCTFPLVTHAGTDKAKRAGRVYLGILLGTSVLFQLLAIIWTWQITGTLDFKPGGVFDSSISATVLGILFALYVFGVGKAALMPFHRWLPAAMVAPTPVSALLHAVAVVKAGVFTVLKVTIYLFGLETLANSGVNEILAYVAGATILLASLIAMTKDNLKARLAYSTVSQLSYIVLGAMLATPLAIAGSAMHIVMHAFGKITLFFCAGAIMVASHKTEISQMRGLGRTMPITMAAFMIGALSIIGLPPLGGMWSKWYIALGTLESGQIALLAVLMISSLLNIAYLLPIPVRAFYTPKDGDAGSAEPVEIKEAPWTSVGALVLTAIGCLLLFLFPDPLYNLLSTIDLRR
uniref:Putative multisubunit Na+/H+ antiporter, MnhA subunit. NADH dehydrogenase (Quinone) n=1 Tax=Magnetococcus massalia (strain MO-1) TaxID=451514 RepID=A0A1S7LKJ3_MAGMO|nr:Putative multisubunit Na+/H+ antiporter, MnhA subunit. NADH dehydrogenase (Quinone) [Candidatus Magnetococcus massalia]